MSKFISVFIPTYNGEKYLAACLDSILSQKLPKGYKLEILITDSGSTDRTLEILNSYEDRISLNEIPNSEFSHGKTRSQAAHKARGEFILFLSQDATPVNSRWIINMIEPFFISDKIGCVFGRQIPRPDAAATIKREVSSVFGGLGAMDALIIYRARSLVDNQFTNPVNTFFSDVNSAARRDLLVGKVPFRNVNYAEDQSLAEDMQNHGYLKVYSPLGEAWHSNEYSVREYYKRKFDEYIGLQKNTNTIIISDKRRVLLSWIRPTIADYKFIRRDRDYGLKSKLLWYVKSPLYNFALQLGKYHATKYLDNPESQRKHSLESKLRK